MRLRSILLAAIMGATPYAVSAAAPCVPQRAATTVPLPGFDSPAELATPPAGTRIRGVLLLFAGSDIADLDGAIVGAGDRIVSRPLRQVADRLACAGFASMRYNKRHVTGANAADRASYDRMTGADLAADGRRALARLRGWPGLAGLPIGLVGWSEGTTVALAVAAAEPGISALVLMAPIVESPARTVQQQYGRIGRPYMARYAVDGALDADAIARADAGQGGVLAKIFVRMFRGFAPGERLNPLLDANADGRIALAEADPIIAGWYADTPGSGLGMAATGRALPGLAAAHDATTPPLLILQGGNDSMIAPGAAQAFAAQPFAPGRVTFRRYAGLGHALGTAASAERDGLLPVDDAPLDAMATWLSRQFAPRTPRR